MTDFVRKSRPKTSRQPSQFLSLVFDMPCEAGRCCWLTMFQREGCINELGSIGLLNFTNWHEFEACLPCFFSALIFYFLPFFVFVKTRNIKSKWVPEFRLLLLFCILDSFINDDFSSLASPGQPLLILTLGFLYSNLQQLKLNGKSRSLT